MDLPSDLIIRPFCPSDQASVKALILAGLEEHWGWLDPTLNPDLNDITGAYADAVFLVAWQGNKLAGCGALLPRSPETAEIVRMSVAAEMRRQGVGGRILSALIVEARRHGFHRIVLETTATWQDAVGFYKRNGFKPTYVKDGDQYFELELSAGKNLQNPPPGVI